MPSVLRHMEIVAKEEDGCKFVCEIVIHRASGLPSLQANSDGYYIQATCGDRIRRTKTSKGTPIVSGMITWEDNRLTLPVSTFNYTCTLIYNGIFFVVVEEEKR